MDVPAEPYRFTSDQDWLPQLKEHGYVVVNVCTPEEVDTARNLFWEFFETAKGAKRDDYETWKNWSSFDSRGIQLDVGTIQSKGAW